MKLFEIRWNWTSLQIREIIMKNPPVFAVTAKPPSVALPNMEVNLLLYDAPIPFWH